MGWGLCLFETGRLLTFLTFRMGAYSRWVLGTALKDVKSFKDLGIIISKDLTWSEHISTMVTSVS